MENQSGPSSLFTDTTFNREAATMITSTNISELDRSQLNGAVDLRLMQCATVIGVGVGRANGLYTELVFSGLGNFSAYDYDRVEPEHLCSQGWEQRDIGKHKVAALGERLRRINDKLKYTEINGSFRVPSDGAIDDMVKSADLMLIMTNNFPVQARANRASIKNGVPTIFATISEKGNYAEISFNIPGITPTCHRCAFPERYAEHEGSPENIMRSSVGGTIFQTRYLNTYLGLLSLAILHRNTKGFEFSNWFGDYWDKNLLELRMYPQLGIKSEQPSGNRFDSALDSHPFEARWKKVEPKSSHTHPICPDCGGTGEWPERKCSAA